jgi:hypothetical protein
MRPARWLALFAAALAAAAACTESTAPIGKGNDFKVDVDSSTQPEQPAEDASGDSPFARVDSPYKPPPDGYAPYKTCSMCSCPAGSYCFGGGTGYETFDGVCDHTGAGPDAGLQIGCESMPPACASKPDCPCLIEALAPYMGCYPVCTPMPFFIVYCPNP